MSLPRLDLLVLGGTHFLGRHVVESALRRGHRVTIFHRGRSTLELPGVERILGDRDGGLEPLRGRRWNAVVDTCGYLPRIVRASARLLADATELYAFISSVSVYRDVEGRVREDAPLQEPPDPAAETVTPENYGGLKALCEREVEAALEGRALIVRPGLIVGPHDPTDRFTYWPVRLAEGGEILAPGRPGRKIQFIDARDLADWLLGLLEFRQAGAYNAVLPPGTLSMGEFLAEAGDTPRLTWVDEAFLAARGVLPYSDLPLWIPGQDDRYDVSRALETNLRFRPLKDTVRDLLASGVRRPLKAGLTPERERELLAAWKNRKEQ